MLTDAWFPLRYHPDQARLWRCPERFVQVAAGRGSGKTELARRRVVRYLPVRKRWSDPMYFYALPTYKQAKRVAWWKILKLIPPHWLKGRPRDGDMMVETVFGSKLFVVGVDKPQRIEGEQWDGCVLDESSDIKPGTFSRSVLPALTHRDGWCWRIGVPKRYGVGATEFRTAWEKGFTTQGSASFGWPSSSVCTPEQLEWALANLDPKDYIEQYDASWVKAGGGIFYAFDRDENIQNYAKYQPELPIIVGVDFNVDPMAWTFSHQVGEEYHTFDELFLSNTNTRAALDWTIGRYGSHEAGWYFFGDATSAARKTSASKTDYEQIAADSRFKRKRMKIPKANPPRADRYARANAMLRNAAGKRRWFINPRCIHLWHDLETLTYKEGSTEPEVGKDDGHASDAATYPVYRLYPIKVQSTSTQVTARSA